ncbi:hypothetical protein MNB_SV-3-474 [hydrothermal vent metagenome]|uniref:Uncharacterized protein n=1 Tax=hydrothermal vent metagenome TaxID=652676 RepID=A0A1W1CC18_9ZZZZ
MKIDIGLKAAIDSDVASASLKAVMQQNSTAGDIEAFAKKAGMDESSAKEFTNAIMAGALPAKDMIAQGITSAAGNLAAALAGAKTGSSLDSIKEAGGKDDYIAMSTAIARGKTASDKERLSHFDNEEEYITSEWKGYLGTGAVVLTAGGAFIAADRSVKHFTGKGIVDRGRSFRRFIGGEESINESSNNKNSKPNPDVGDKTVSKQHNNSPSINSRIHNSNIKTPRTQAWYKEIGKSFAKTKAGKILGAGAAMVGLSSVADAAEQEYLEFTADNATTMPPQNNTSELSSTDAAVVMGTAVVVNGATAMYGMEELKVGSQQLLLLVYNEFDEII